MLSAGFRRLIVAANSVTQPGASWAALRYSNFRWMYTAQFFSTIGNFMQMAAVNWHVYALTGDPVALGLVGLVRIAPIIILSLLGGVVADALDRRRLMLWTQSVMLACAGSLALATLSGWAALPVIYLMTAAMAGASAFDRPAWAALLPNLVPEEQTGNAIRLNVVLIQITAVTGPVLAGLLLGAVSPGIAYAVNAISFVPVVLVLFFVRPRSMKREEKSEISLAALFEGVRFIRQTPLLWSTMLLDFFATFFSSALALLPVYASEILHVGAAGYGLLYAAPSIGATTGALIMAQMGGRLRRQGQVMLWAVAFYGLATIIFGVSTSFWLSLLALAITGLADSISMVVRNAIRLLMTPDRLRGRMVSVNMIFYMGGPQLGEFEAGVLARLSGPVFSVVSGGVITILVVLATAYAAPLLREYEEISSIHPAADNQSKIE